MANVVLKDKNGNTNAFDGIYTISVPGHNDEGVAEDILFKKVVAGVVTGSIKMTSGEYTTKDYGEKIFSEIPSHFNGWTFNSNGYWEKTKDAGSFKLVAGKKYYIRYISNGTSEAVAHTSFDKYGKCVTLGNESLIKKYGGGGNYLIIYQEGTNKVTIIAEPLGCYGDSPDDVTNLYDVSVHSIDGGFGGMRIQHGGDTKPDAVFVMLSSVSMSTDFYGLNYAFWGFKSSLAHLLPNNKVSGGASLFSTTTADQPLENSSNSSMLYCPDEKTFALKENGNTLVWAPRSKLFWFAFWGIGDQSE